MEPAFAELSKLRSKKRAICHYVKPYPRLPEDVRRSLIRKADRLEHMIQTMDAPYRKKRHYCGMLDQESHAAVNACISSIKEKKEMYKLKKLWKLKTATKFLHLYKGEYDVEGLSLPYEIVSRKDEGEMFGGASLGHGTDAVCIIPFFENGDVLATKEFRYAVNYSRLKSRASRA